MARPAEDTTWTPCVFQNKLNESLLCLMFVGHLCHGADISQRRLTTGHDVFREYRSPNPLRYCIMSASSYHKTLISSTTAAKPKVIGLYGLPGAGKTTLLDTLLREESLRNYLFVEGSEQVAKITGLGGIETFKKLPEAQKLQIRHREARGRHEREGKDRLEEWQDQEGSQLRKLCREHDILFTTIIGEIETVHSKALRLVQDFGVHDELYNLQQAEKALDDVVSALSASIPPGGIETMLVLDGDKTLGPYDTGKLFFQAYQEVRGSALREKNLIKAAINDQSKLDKRMTALSGGAGSTEDPLKTLFSSPLKYSYNAFRQATLMYDETGPTCETVCMRVAGVINMCCKSVWEDVIKRYELSNRVKVMGGGHITDGLVMMQGVKGALVHRLRHHHGAYVWAFGDSSLDMDMLKEADQALVVVGEENQRSKSMEECLRGPIDHDGLRVRQVLLPEGIGIRGLLHPVRLPIVTMQDVVPNIFDLKDVDLEDVVVDFQFATNEGAEKLMTTPTRNAALRGVPLREAHRNIGEYLARLFLPEKLGLEKYEMTRVQQGKITEGHRLRDEEKTLIVALMRGGEPMALGVSNVLPLAGFLHAKKPEQVTPGHVAGQSAVILVDSVINTGAETQQFVRHVRSLSADIRIVVMANVVQADSVSADGVLTALGRELKFSLIGLRTSDNMFKGKGGTDTGNRLFNITQLD
ncbi:hypothetical protein BAUCODRAFT_572591 [Baudoinia panamericana UAMH 10762]|uniref:AAA+ ATPase domain-containing protein n=1 Tax=Baudoinia panamericana (strain UAMH 10762) TaxID=717646 RepID=M2NLG3_BAUPA|nr:uncharacterized protein BAUCODRAFT_572591 [Baudoinia panamericana UAMH 10762]EMD00330.1 hypothetical protein BAUCODRAFT_572591 [Baudoinia panamericana UAMH 10762]